MFFEAGHIKSKQIDEKWTKKKRLGNFVVQRNREVDTSGGNWEVHCHNVSPVLFIVSEITFKVNYCLRSFTTDLLTIIKHYLQFIAAVSLKYFFKLKNDIDKFMTCSRVINAYNMEHRLHIAVFLSTPSPPEAEVANKARFIQRPFLSLYIFHNDF